MVNYNLFGYGIILLNDKRAVHTDEDYPHLQEREQTITS